MNSTLETLFGLLGGLAVFIYGMNLMSEGLQKAAGEKMKKILGILTKNPIMGVLAGALVTAVLQSSSATTVMVIGFVSAGLMTLPQAISVILGANIGTTMTAQLIAFKIDDLVWPIVFIGFVLYFFAKKESLKNIGQTIFAFGLLFVGIITMGNVMKPLASSPVFTQMIEQVAHIPVLGVLAGTLMTLVVQSSSATIAVLQNFAVQAGPDGVSSVIGLAGAIPILLGDNIGTTITALFACIGQSKNAKRTAVAHSVFNITGSVVFLCIIPWFAKFVQWISPKGAEIDVISRQIANAHTSFNIANTLIWLPMIAVMVKIVMTLVPGKDGQEEKVGQPVYIDVNMKNQPVFAMYLIRKEVVHMGKNVCQMVEQAKDAFVNKNVEAYKQVKQRAEDIANVQQQSVQYMSALMSEGVLTEEQTRQTAAYMYVMNEMERIGRGSEDIASVAEMKQEKGFKFSKDAIREIEDSLSSISFMVKGCANALEDGNQQMIEQVVAKKNEALTVEARLMKNHMDRLKKGKCSPEFTMSFNMVLHNLERMNNSCVNAAELIEQEVDLSENLEEIKDMVAVTA